MIPGLILTHSANKTIKTSNPSFEQISIKNNSGNNVKGWHIRTKESDKIILLLHPLRCNREFMLKRVNFLQKNGYSVCLIDMQAHGETIGKRITFGYKESDDVEATVNYLKNVLEYKKVAIIGVSLGGAASILCGEDLNADAMILESVYPKIKKAISNRIRMRLGPLEKVLTPILMAQIRPILQIDPKYLNPINQINQTNLPKFIISGKNDLHTTEDETKLLFNAITSKKELWLIENAKHEDLYEFNPLEYEKRIINFLKHNI